jgi:hypothetical protein
VDRARFRIVRATEAVDVAVERTDFIYGEFESFGDDEAGVFFLEVGKALGLEKILEPELLEEQEKRLALIGLIVIYQLLTHG